MGLCGSSNTCGCALSSAAATEGVLDTFVPTIEVTGSGIPGDPWGLMLEPDWAQAVVDHITDLEDDVAYPENGTYTPTLTGMVVGTGGSAANSASYTFVGGNQVGDVGVLRIEWRMVFGTAGTTFPTAPTISLPAGFNLVQTNTSFPIGRAYLGDSGTAANDRWAEVAPNSVSTFRILLGGISGAVATLSTTTPFTWAINDIMGASLTVRAIRV